jgi:hypothetical protein
MMRNRTFGSVPRKELAKHGPTFSAGTVMNENRFVVRFAIALAVVFVLLLLARTLLR